MPSMEHDTESRRPSSGLRHFPIDAFEHQKCGFPLNQCVYERAFFQAEHCQMLVNSTATVPEQPQPETLAGFAVSLAFWCCLMLSAVLFGAVALSPKVQVYMQLREQFESNQLQLVGLEKQAGRLQKVVDAIRGDKQFASEMTRIELDAVQPDEEVLPVDADLKLDAGTTGAEGQSHELHAVWYAPFIRALVVDQRLRITVLSAAALLVVVSFTVLQPAGSARATPEHQVGATVWYNVRNRYVQRI